MSFSALYEYMHGEFQDVTRVPLAAAGVDPAWIIDPNGVKIAGHQIELWDAETGGTQLLEGVDYSLVFLDSGKTAAEGIDIWAGYQVINVAYQGIPLYLTARIIGGYTQYPSGRIVFDEAVGDQWVTKWDTGRMEIRIIEMAIIPAVSIETGLLGGYRSDPVTIAIYANPFITAPTVSAITSTTSFSFTISDSSSNIEFIGMFTAIDTQSAGDREIHFAASGRWK